MAAGTAAAASLRERAGLTTRGWAFLATGALVVGVGMVRGLVPVVQFGVLVGLLPLVAAAVTRGPRARLDLSRSLSARELPSGDELRVTVSVRGRFPRWRTLLLEDTGPAALGGSHRFALSGISGDAISRPHYRVRTGARGAHHLGPMRFHVVDRFGLVHRVLIVGGRDEVVVFPRVVPLDPVVLGGASMGSGSGRLGSRGASSDDVIPRDYHPGDEVRRIDWKASARTGTLMVRSEENPWRASVGIVVDLRESGHHGHSPDSSVDAVLGVVASVGCMALDAGWDVSVRTTDDLPVFAGSPLTGVVEERRELLRALAVEPVSHSVVPSDTLRHTADVSSNGPVVLVVGHVSPPVMGMLAGVGAHSGQRILVSVAAEDWRTGADRPDTSTSGRGDGLDVFLESGWRVVRLRRGDDIQAAWAGVAVGR